jgi:RNA polymerase sigma factor (sigma-70 family)
MSTEEIVYVVDDDPAMRQSLCWLLQSVGLVCEEFASAEEFLGAYDADCVACLILDVRMPGIGGLTLQEKLTERGGLLPIIFVTAHAEVATAVRALKRGALDYLEKPFSDQALVDRVREALELNRRNRSEEQRRAEAAQRLAQLSPRQLEVMELVLDGKSNKLIAEHLGIREKTVEVHRSELMRKLGVNSVAALVQLVIRSPRPAGKPAEAYRKFLS